METKLRKTGIAPIRDTPWSTHFCQFYKNEKDLVDVLVPYFEAGLKNNEYCLWVICNPLDARRARAAMARRLPDIDVYIERGQLEIVPHAGSFVRDGKFDGAQVLKGWIGRLNRALEMGYDGLRLTGNICGLDPGKWHEYNKYERVVNQVIRNKRILALCTYPLEICSASDVMEVVAAHNFALTRRKGRWQVLAVEDTARRKRMEDELRSAAVRLEASNKELKAFNYSVSHDLRAPLRAIDGFSRILVEDYEKNLDDEGKRILGVIRGNTRKMGQLIDDLLSLSRVGRHAIKVEKIDMELLFEEQFEELRRLYPERRIELELGHLPAAMGDGMLITPVITNLLSNAIKFTGPRDVARIEVQGAARNGHNVYCVTDNGVGYDMRYAGKLFGVFQRLHLEDEFEGTGVGLAIVRRVVQRHGGDIWSEAEPDKGAKFCFTLPS